VADATVGAGALMPGAERFNKGEYFEAHEEWEKAWYGTEGEENRFLKGLIQVAVSLYHLESGNLPGARKVMLTALEYLREFPSSRSGVDLDHLRAQVLPFSRELEEGRDPYPMLAAAPPKIRIAPEQSVPGE
jgi:predicted metal-dependent hydrolase